MFGRIGVLEIVAGLVILCGVQPFGVMGAVMFTFAPFLWAI